MGAAADDEVERQRRPEVPPAAGERHGGGGVLHREEGHDVAQHAVGEKADDVLPVFFLHGRRLGLNLSHLYPANPNKQGFFWI